MRGFFRWLSGFVGMPPRKTRPEIPPPVPAAPMPDDPQSDPVGGGGGASTSPSVADGHRDPLLPIPERPAPFLRKRIPLPGEAPPFEEGIERRIGSGVAAIVETRRRAAASELRKMAEQSRRDGQERQARFEIERILSSPPNSGAVAELLENGVDLLAGGTRLVRRLTVDSRGDVAGIGSDGSVLASLCRSGAERYHRRATGVEPERGMSMRR